MTSIRIKPAIVILMIAAFAVPTTASAYVGPGVGITVVGAVLAFVASVCLAIIGFIWYPIKKLVRKMSSWRGGRGRVHPAND